MFDNRLVSTVLVFSGKLNEPVTMVAELSRQSTPQEREDALWLAFDDAAARWPGEAVRAFVQVSGRPDSEIRSFGG